jgi:hypothetical protein
VNPDHPEFLFSLVLLAAYNVFGFAQAFFYDLE